MVAVDVMLPVCSVMVVVEPLSNSVTVLIDVVVSVGSTMVVLETVPIDDVIVVVDVMVSVSPPSVKVEPVPSGTLIVVGVDTDRLSLVATFMGHAMSLLSKNVHSTKFVVFMLDYVIEHIDKLPLSSDDKLDLFRILAEMCPFCTEFDRPKERLAKLFNVLMTFLPEPPVESEASTNDVTPDFQFSFIECLMYGLHQLSRKYPDFLIAEENEERVKDFRLRLRYLYRGASSYTTQLKNALNGKVEGDEQDEQKKTRLIAYKICSNVQIMIRDLCRSPPSFKSNVILSWKPTEELKRSHSESDGGATTNKNGVGTSTSTVPASANTTNKRPRPEKQLYRPPSGGQTGGQKNRRGGYQRY
ncbi:unnamed protein product [Rotaria sp. Silwood1]|nr:unnamed protein product [Rotaria sp. Silwood1]